MPVDDRDRVDPLPPLGPRAAEVLELVLRGRTDGEIGEALAMSPITAEHYRRRLMQARGVATTPKLLAQVWAERVAVLEAEVARLTRELRLLSRRVDEADNRRVGPADRRGVVIDWE